MVDSSLVETDETRKTNITDECLLLYEEGLFVDVDDD